MEKHTRTIFKTLSWRIVATSTTLLLVYFFTEDIVLSVGVGIIESFLKTLIYYIHERVWNRTDYGRKFEQHIPIETIRYSNISKEKIETKNKEVNALTETILKLEEKTRIIKDNLEQLKATEEIKTEWIVEINNNLSEKENELNALEENLEKKTSELGETNIKFNKLSEGLNIKVREIGNRPNPYIKNG